MGLSNFKSVVLALATAAAVSTINTDSKSQESDVDQPATHCSTALRPTEVQRLSIALRMQALPAWCWASVATMVADYYGRQDPSGYPVQECVLASVKAGFMPPNTAMPLCCVPSIALQNPACNQRTNFGEISQALSRFGLRSRFESAPISEDALLTEVANGRPVIIVFMKAMQAHVVLVDAIKRFDDGSYHFEALDPQLGVWHGTYEFLRNSYAPQGEAVPWVYTYTRISPRADGCNMAFDPLCSGSCR